MADSSACEVTDEFCKANPDVAGTGVSPQPLVCLHVLMLCKVVFAFIASAVLSVMSSLLMILCTKHFAPRWISKKLLLSDTKTQVLGDTMESLAVTQLVTGIGIAIATWTEYGHSWEDPHALLAAALCVLATCSQACPVALLLSSRHMNAWTAYIHVCLSIFPGELIFGLYFTVNRSDKPSLRWINVGLLFSTIYQILATVLFVGSLAIANNRKKKLPLNGTTALYINGLALIILAYPTTLVVYLKWFNKECDMTRCEDKTWNSFGQLLAIVMLLTVPISVIDGYQGRSCPTCTGDLY